MKHIKKWLPMLWSLPLLVPAQMIAMILMDIVGALFGNTMSMIVIVISCFITGGIVALPSLYVVSENVENRRLRVTLLSVLILVFGALVLWMFLSFNHK